MDFCGNEAAHSLLHRLDEFPNVAILRTFSKSFGLAGLRLGFGVMPAELASAIKRVRLPFSINILAEIAATAALEDTAFRELTLETVARGRETLSAGLRELGFVVRPSQANFLLVTPPYPAADLVEDLLRKGIIIRWLKSYAMPEYARISIGNGEENRMLLETVASLLQHRRLK